MSKQITKTNKQLTHYRFFIFIAIFALIAVLIVLVVRAGSGAIVVDVANDDLSIVDATAYGGESIEFKEAQTSPDPIPSPIPGRKLLWSDEFDYTGEPNPEYWSYEVGRVRNNELQYYTDNRRENARVEGGNLVIEARKESYEGASYTAANVISKDKYEFKYGRLEFRAKFTAAKGSWSALWTMGHDFPENNWPRNGEMDVMENIGFQPNEVFQAVHAGPNWWDKEEKQKYSHGTFYKNKFDTSKYNTYAIEWTDKKIDFFVNDDKHFTHNRIAGEDFKWPFAKDHYILMNIAVGGDWGGQQGVDDSAFPHSMQVDYVRVYEPL